MTFLAALSAWVPLHIARRAATRKTYEAHPATAIVRRVVEHLLVKVSGDLVLVACVAEPRPALEAVLLRRGERRCISLLMTNFAGVAVRAAEEEVLCLICSVVQLALREAREVQAGVANRARLLLLRRTALGAHLRVTRKRAEVGEVDAATNARLAGPASAMELALQVSFGRTELRSRL